MGSVEAPKRAWITVQREVEARARERERWFWHGVYLGVLFGALLVGIILWLA